MNRTWTAKLQVALLIFPERIVLTHFQSLFVRSNPNAFWDNEGKINEEECVKVNLYVGISQLDYEFTSS